MDKLSPDGFNSQYTGARGEGECALRDSPQQRAAGGQGTSTDTQAAAANASKLARLTLACSNFQARLRKNTHLGAPRTSRLAVVQRGSMCQGVNGRVFMGTAGVYLLAGGRWSGRGDGPADRGDSARQEAAGHETLMFGYTNRPASRLI